MIFLVIFVCGLQTVAFANDFQNEWIFRMIFVVCWRYWSRRVGDIIVLTTRIPKKHFTTSLLFANTRTRITHWSRERKIRGLQVGLRWTMAFFLGNILINTISVMLIHAAAIHLTTDHRWFMLVAASLTRAWNAHTHHKIVVPPY